MPLGINLDNGVFLRALVAYIHYLSFMLCFGALVLERKILKTSPNREEAISMVVIDVFYGVAALTLLISGIMRVLYFGQGSEFYTNNLFFWIKVALFIFVGVLSLYPTITYVFWAVPLSKGDLPEVNSNLVDRLRKIINVELLGFALIPFFATLMARGIKFL